MVTTLDQDTGVDSSWQQSVKPYPHGLYVTKGQTHGNHPVGFRKGSPG